jgi:hypothetical protein
VGDFPDRNARIFEKDFIHTEIAKITKIFLSGWKG